MDTGQSKYRLLIVDGDPKSLRVLEVSLKKAGFGVTTASNANQALAAMGTAAPDMIISDTDLDGTDGFELCRQIKARPEWAKTPFLFVSGRKSIEDKIRGLELGVDDYLTKPIYIKEIGIRVRTALQRAERERLESRRDTRTRFSGDLADIGVVDLVQTIELNRKSGIVHIADRAGRRGAVFFRDGRVIDAEVGRLAGPEAMYRLFSWSEGRFEVEFKPIRRRDVIEVPTAALLMEGMRRLDEWTRLLENLPGLDKVVEVDYRVLAEQLAELPDEVNGLLRLCDGSRSLLAVIDDSDYPDLEALTIASNLFTQHILYVREPGGHSEAEPSGELARWLEEGNALVSKGARTPANTLLGMGAGEIAPFGEEADSVRTFTGEFQFPSLDTPDSLREPDDATPRAIPARKNNTLRLPAPVSPTPSEASTPSTPNGGALGSSETTSLPADAPSASAEAKPEGAPELFPVPKARPHKSGALTDTLRGIPIPQEQGSSEWATQSELQPEALAEGAAVPSARLRDTLIGHASGEQAIPEPVTRPAGGEEETDWGGWAQGAEKSSDVRQCPEPTESPSGSMTDEDSSDRAPGMMNSAPSAETPKGQASASKAEHLRTTFVMSGRLEPARRPRTAPIAYCLGLLVAAGLLVWQVRSRNPEAAPPPAAPAASLEPAPVADSGTTEAIAATAKLPPDASPALAIRPDAKPSGRAKVMAEPGKQAEGQAIAENAAAPDVVERCRKLGASSRSKPAAVLAACQTANQADANAVDIMVILARVELDRGNTNEARSWAKKAVEIKPDLADAYVFIGGAEQEAGNSNEAKAAYKKYLELAPTGRYARELRAVLESL